MGVIPTPTNFKTLTFDGENSRSYGVYITGEGVFNAPERNVEMVEIPGRNGAFALDKGNFNNIEVTYPAGIFADTEADFAQAVSDFRNFLCSKVGYVRLEDDYNPNEYRLAIYKSGLEVDHDLLIAGEFDLVFECKPQRYLKSGETPITIGEWGETTTYTGEIAQFENPNGWLAVKSLTADIEPLQDLHGYDKPWVGGAGKQLLPNRASYSYNGITYTRNADGSVTVNGTATALSAYNLFQTSDVANLTPSETYHMRLVGYEGTDIRMQAYSNNTWVAETYGTDKSFTIPSDSTTNIVRLRVSEGTTIDNVTIYPMVSKTEITEYEPYENICPITGWTGCDAYVRGKNLISASFGEYVPLYLPKGTVLIVSAKSTGTPQINYYDANQTRIDYWSCQYDAVDGRMASRAFTLLDDAYYFRFTGTSSTEYQLEFGDTATAYEPYNGTTYPVSWQTEAGTVYGGTVDVVSGVLTAYPYYASYNGETLVGPWVSSMDEYIEGRTPTTGAQVVDFGGTPTTYQLDPVQVALLIGHNNVWNNVGNTSIEVGNDPNSVINPTRFDAQPLLEIEGYGNVKFNGYNIELFDDLVGNVFAELQTSYTLPYSTYLGNIYVNANDVITTHPTGLGNGFSFSAYGERKDGYTAAINSYTATNIQCTGISTSNVIVSAWTDTDSFECMVGFKNVDFSAITEKTITVSWDCTLIDSNGDQFKWHPVATVHYDGVAFISYSFTGLDFPNVFYMSGNPTVGLLNIQIQSTATTYGHPTMIDCETGETYTIQNGVAMSLGRYVSLGSELPTLASGANTITYDNTITLLKITPRWWQV